MCRQTQLLQKMSKNNALKLAMMGYSLVASLAFFLSDGKYLRKEVVDIFFEMVKELHDVFETQTEYNFVGMTRFRTAPTYLCSRCRLSLTTCCPNHSRLIATISV